MIYRNAPLKPTGRLRMVLRHLDDGIPKVHVAAEFRVSRPTVATWVTRYPEADEAGLADRPSTPRRIRAGLLQLLQGFSLGWAAVISAVLIGTGLALAVKIRWGWLVATWKWSQ